MSQAENTKQRKGATYFGESSPHDLKNLENNAKRATSDQMAKAAAYLEQAFSGMLSAWFGGWALNLRGSRRETHDLDVIVLVRSVTEIRVVLAQYSWAILPFYGTSGDVQQRMFVKIDEGDQVVGVDIVLSGALDTPDLGMAGSYETIVQSFPTPTGNQVNVIHLTWQVEGKLIAWFSRRKDSDLLDLEFLLLKYSDEIEKWSDNIGKNLRETFYEIYALITENETTCEVVKKTLNL